MAGLTLSDPAFAPAGRSSAFAALRPPPRSPIGYAIGLAPLRRSLVGAIDGLLRRIYGVHTRFQLHRAEIAKLADERFCRMWELYLAAAEMQVRHLNTMVFQIQLSREVDGVPLVRDYMYHRKEPA